MHKRKSKEINLLNHTGAILVAIDQATKKGSSKLEVSKWLPFDLGDPNVIVVSAAVESLLLELRDKDEIPAPMLRDLYKFKVIQPSTT